MGKRKYEQFWCWMCKPQLAFSSKEKLFNHMKDVHQGTLWPNKNHEGRIDQEPVSEP